MFSLITWINGLVNNREAGDFRRLRAHCDVTVMIAAIKQPIRNEHSLDLRLHSQHAWLPWLHVAAGSCYNTVSYNTMQHGNCDHILISQKTPSYPAALVVLSSWRRLIRVITGPLSIVTTATVNSCIVCTISCRGCSQSIYVYTFWT